MSDTKKGYEIGAYYEFSDNVDFERSTVDILYSVSKNSVYKFLVAGGAGFKYARELSAPVGKITKPKPLSGFINIYRGEQVSIMGFLSRHKADLFGEDHHDKRVACIDLSKFNEGEGL